MKLVSSLFSGSPLEDDEEIEETVEQEDEGMIEQLLDTEIKKETTLINKQPSMQQSPFGRPWGNTGGSESGTSPWQRSSNNQRSDSPWSTPSKGTWATGGRTNDWNWRSGGNNERYELPRNKKVIFCDLLDCVLETYAGTSTQGLTPRDIYDLRPRFDVWEKLGALNPDLILVILPSRHIPVTNGRESWVSMLNYYTNCLSSFLKLPSNRCQALAFAGVRYDKAELLSHAMIGFDPAELLYVGVYSGMLGQSNADIEAARKAGIDYVDVEELVKNYF